MYLPTCFHVFFVPFMLKITLVDETAYIIIMFAKITWVDKLIDVHHHHHHHHHHRHQHFAFFCLPSQGNSWCMRIQVVDGVAMLAQYPNTNTSSILQMFVQFGATSLSKHA